MGCRSGCDFALGTPNHSRDGCPHPPEGLGHIGIGRASAVEETVDLIKVVTFDGEAGGRTRRIARQ